MTERDFEHIVGMAEDWLKDPIKHRYQASTMRIVFLSDDEGVVEIRWTRK